MLRITLSHWFALIFTGTCLIVPLVEKAGRGDLLYECYTSNRVPRYILFDPKTSLSLCLGSVTLVFLLVVRFGNRNNKSVDKKEDGTHSQTDPSATTTVASTTGAPGGANAASSKVPTTNSKRREREDSPLAGTIPLPPTANAAVKRPSK
ncbi:unnamed protein product, partial [Amoebophrya sp. A25]|eukprot:GSA25T00010103001.1